MNKTFSYIVEIVWLIISIVGLVIAIYQTYLVGFNKSYIFFIITAIALLMYIFRRYLRLNHKRNSQ